MLTPAETEDYLDAAERLGYLPMFLLALTAGLRQGELTALKWSDLDIKKRTLIITEKRSVERRELVEYEGGTRIVSLTPEAVELLRLEHAKHPRSPLMFMHPATQRPYSPQIVRRLHNEIIREVGLDHISARSEGSCGSFCGAWKWIKIQAVLSSLRSQSPKAYCRKKKTGVNPLERSQYEQKREILPLPVTGEKAILKRWYQEDGSRSITAFIERAVDFYLDYLSANSAGLFLPISIKSYLDGRMGQLEELLPSIAFRQAVEQDMVADILADEYQFSGEDLRRRRAESVQNVRKTRPHLAGAAGAWRLGG